MGSEDLLAYSQFAGAVDEESGDGEILDGDTDGVVEGDLIGVGASGNGIGHISFEHAKAGGIMPNSVYYGRTEPLDELAPALTGFVDDRCRDRLLQTPRRRRQHQWSQRARPAQ